MIGDGKRCVEASVDVELPELQLGDLFAPDKPKKVMGPGSPRARRRLPYAPTFVAYCRSLPVNPGRSITSRLTMPNGTLPR